MAAQSVEGTTPGEEVLGSNHAVTARSLLQTCHFDLTQNLNECDKKIWIYRKESEFDYQNRTFI